MFIKLIVEKMKLFVCLLLAITVLALFFESKAEIYYRPSDTGEVWPGQKGHQVGCWHGKGLFYPKLG